MQAGYLVGSSSVGLRTTTGCFLVFGKKLFTDCSQGESTLVFRGAARQLIPAPSNQSEMQRFTTIRQRHCAAGVLNSVRSARDIVGSATDVWVSSSKIWPCTSSPS